MSFTETSGVQYQTGQTWFQSETNRDLRTFIPEIWSAQLFTDLESSIILSSPTVTNRQYEGEFRTQGDTVRIPHWIDTARVESGYDPYGEIGDATRAELDSILMRIDQARTVHWEVDSLHQLQTKAGLSLMQQLVGTHARALAESVDRHVAATIRAAVRGHDLNRDKELHGTITTVDPVSTDTELYERIIEMRTILDINNVPSSGRYLILGPAEYARVLRDPRFVDASQYGAGAVVANGEVGRIAGLRVINSNALGSHLTDAAYADLPGVKGSFGVRKPNSGGEGIHMIVGHSMAVSFASQLSKLEPYKPEKKFTDAVKGLFIFGCKVMRPEAMVISGVFEDADPDPSP